MERQRDKYPETKHDVLVLTGESKRSAVEKRGERANSDEGKGGGGASVLAGPLRVSGVSIVGEIKASSPKELGEKRDRHVFLHL